MIDFIFGEHRSEAGEAITRSYYCLVPLFLKSAALANGAGMKTQGRSSLLTALFVGFQLLTSLHDHNITTGLLNSCHLPLSVALDLKIF